MADVPMLLNVDRCGRIRCGQSFRRSHTLSKATSAETIAISPRRSCNSFATASCSASSVRNRFSVAWRAMSRSAIRK